MSAANEAFIKATRTLVERIKKEYAPQPLEWLEVKPGRCECGSEAVGSLRHSTWCPSHEKDK